MFIPSTWAVLQVRSVCAVSVNMILILFYNVFGFLKMENWSTNHREETIKPCSHITKFSLKLLPIFPTDIIL